MYKGDEASRLNVWHCGGLFKKHIATTCESSLGHGFKEHRMRRNSSSAEGKSHYPSWVLVTHGNKCNSMSSSGFAFNLCGLILVGSWVTFPFTCAVDGVGGWLIIIYPS